MATGLGLATVYGIVRQHEGHIQVDSEVDRGTTFRIYLPLAEPSVAAAAVGDDSPAAGGSETVLVAEDDELVRELARRILARAGSTVLTADDGEQALEVFAAHGEEIDLLLLDMVMPGLSGRKVLGRIRKQRPDIRALFATGYSADSAQAGFVPDARTSLIQKPFHGADLRRKVRAALASGAH